MLYPGRFELLRFLPTNTQVSFSAAVAGMMFYRAVCTATEQALVKMHDMQLIHDASWQSREDVHHPRSPKTLQYVPESDT